ncbi:MAG: terpene cyclase/mutase family protein [Phycisphaerales bacterium]|nr:terpene cyclase/mutase family protein [Phycisphaerales bacterium]
MLVAGSSVHAQPGGGNSRSTMGGTGPMKDELTKEIRDQVGLGLKWLSKNIDASSSMGGYGNEVGIVALAGLAFMADGSMPGEGPYGKEVEKVLSHVMKHSQASGLIASPQGGSPMYGHGFATLFLAEVYGMGGGGAQREDVKESLRRAIALICRTQNHEGGWRYQPVKNDADLSVTICQVMALRAAKNAGIQVPKAVIDKAIDYVKKSQEPDGGFSYMLQGRGSGYARSAAGLACLFYAGIYEGKEIESAVKYLTKGGGGGRNEGHYYYGVYYAVQAMFMAGGKTWEEAWPKMSQDLIRRQQSDGRWTGDASDLYATSMALIALQVPNRLLPILQK